MSFAIQLAEKGLLPENIIRMGMRNLISTRLRSITEDSTSKDFANILKKAPIAIETDAANEQHYEVPANFFEYALGKKRKYSCCYFPDNTDSLDQAEIKSLEQIAQRAQLANGQSVLELGCGWGSFTLWYAQTYPNSTIVGVSNSDSQREYILGKAKERGLGNIQILTENMKSFSTERRFDRVVSIEMFEHMQNYKELLKRISAWLLPDGLLFVHVFCHAQFPYFFQDKNEKDWMSRYFFTGGIMPSFDLFSHFQEDLTVEQSWWLNGKHYKQTAEAWAQNMLSNKTEIQPILEKTYGAANASTWFNRWHMFFLACAELFGYQDGKQWGVGHYLFKQNS